MGKGYSPEQIVRKLRDAEGKLASGSTVPEVARELGISEATFHRWRKQYGGMSPQEAKRLKELERECAPEEDGRRPSSGYRHPQGGESRKRTSFLSPARRKKAVTHVQKTFSLSERRARHAMDQPRSTQRYTEHRPGADQALSSRISELSRQNPRYGYRRVWALLRREGWAVNKKRVRRIWREAGLKVPQKQHKSSIRAGV
jgi:transposase